MLWRCVRSWEAAGVNEGGWKGINTPPTSSDRYVYFLGVPDHPVLVRIIRASNRIGQNTLRNSHGRIIRPRVGWSDPDPTQHSFKHEKLSRIPRAGSSGHGVGSSDRWQKVSGLEAGSSGLGNLEGRFSQERISFQTEALWQPGSIDSIPLYSTVVLYSNSKRKSELNHQWTPPSYIFELGTFFSSSSQLFHFIFAHNFIKGGIKFMNCKRQNGRALPKYVHKQLKVVSNTNAHI
jgi:hypothetical protein